MNTISHKKEPVIQTHAQLHDMTTEKSYRSDDQVISLLLANYVVNEREGVTFAPFLPAGDARAPLGEHASLQGLD